MTATLTETTQIVLPGQSAAPDGPVDFIAMYLMHHGFRRDLNAFTRAVPRTPVDDLVTWRALADRWDLFFDILHKHHSGEDAGFWPLLLARSDAAGDTSARATLEAMESEHAGIDPLLEGCAADFARLAEGAGEDVRELLGVRLVVLNDLLARHLAHEEGDALVIAQRYITNDDWHRLEAEYFRPKYKPSQIPAVGSWLMHELPEDQHARVRDTMVGRPLMFLWRAFWRRGFERRDRAAFRYTTSTVE